MADNGEVRSPDAAKYYYHATRKRLTIFGETTISVAGIERVALEAAI